MKKLEKYLINFEELKVGDKLWDCLYGSVYISSLTHGEYCITVTNETGHSAQYNKKGFFTAWAASATLFKSNPFLGLKEEPRMIEVLLWGKWEKLELIVVRNDIAITWNDSKGHSLSFKKPDWREIQPEVELTDKERITELEKEVAELKEKLLIPKVASAKDIPSRDYLDKIAGCGTGTSILAKDIKYHTK